jgi:hypothetical protein
MLQSVRLFIGVPLQYEYGNCLLQIRYDIGETFVLQNANVTVTPFSFNIDESTSSYFKKMLTILVSYFCPLTSRGVVQYFVSLSCIKVNNEPLYNEVVRLMDDNKIPWQNLMDSCNVMRCSKSGPETRLRNKKAAHLLDIDGDTCHRIHNAAKGFCKPFNT